jgi:hypothetical protein
MIKVGPDGTGCQPQPEILQSRILFPSANLDIVSLRSLWTETNCTPMAAPSASREPLVSRDSPPKQRVFKGIVHPFLPESSRFHGFAQSRNSGNQIAWLLADPFGLIHQFSISSFQRSSVPSFIGSIRD